MPTQTKCMSFEKIIRLCSWTLWFFHSAKPNTQHLWQISGNRLTFPQPPVSDTKWMHIIKYSNNGVQLFICAGAPDKSTGVLRITRGIQNEKRYIIPADRSSEEYLPGSAKLRYLTRGGRRADRISISGNCLLPSVKGSSCPECGRTMDTWPVFPTQLTCY